MPLESSGNMYQHVSDFDKGRVVAYQDCSLSYRSIAARVGRDPMTQHGLSAWRLRLPLKLYHRQECLQSLINDEPGCTNCKTSSSPYVISRCYSYVGRVGGAQKLSLGNGCNYVGTIVHELGHALGLFHEHQRSDRDEYINVYLQNVIANQTHNFKKTESSKELIFTSYDYSSIMHYGEYAFSKKFGKLKTMEAKNGTPLKEPYHRPGLNQNDIKMVNELYKK
ncbi:astacin [Trichonephila clavipes]|nr:astacin [Trichonephila clavipes]